MLSEIKVTDDDPANEGTPGSGDRDCRPSPTERWPYSRGVLRRFYGDDDFTSGLWSLNSARDTVIAMEATNQNLYIADVDGASLEFGREPGVTECDWYSLAALNDYIQDRMDSATDPSDYPMYTGIYIGPGSPSEVRQHFPSTYLPWLVRVRQEAAEHPDVMKLVYLDEPWRLLKGPENAFHQAYDHWDVTSVQELYEMAHAPASVVQRMLQSLGQQGRGPDLGLHQVELWVRMLDYAALRYIVPSCVLGVPSKPGDGSSYDPDDYEWAEPGSGVWVEWTVPSSPACFPARVYLEFVYGAGPGGSPRRDLELQVYCNTTLIETVTVAPAVGIDHRKTVRFARIDLSMAWRHRSSALNRITMVYSHADGSTNPSMDRTVFIAGARVLCVDAEGLTTNLSAPFLDPERARYGVQGVMPSTTLSSSNANWRISRYVDGVGLVFDTRSGAEFDIDGFRHLLEYATWHLHSAYSRPKRCVVSENAQLTSPEQLPLLNPAATLERMDAAGSLADGVIAEFLPMELEFLRTDGSGPHRGRFTPRRSLSSRAPGPVAYEARLTRTYLGETHEWRAVVSASDTYVVRWRIREEINQPDMRWFIQGVTSGGEDIPGGYGLVSDPDNSGTVPLQLHPGDTIIVGWTGDWDSAHDGPTVRDSNYVQFHVTPESRGRLLDWTYLPSVAEVVHEGVSYPSIRELYDSIVCWFWTQDSGPCLDA